MGSCFATDESTDAYEHSPNLTLENIIADPIGNYLYDLFSTLNSENVAKQDDQPNNINNFLQSMYGISYIKYKKYLSHNFNIKDFKIETMISQTMTETVYECKLTNYPNIKYTMKKISKQRLFAHNDDTTFESINTMFQYMQEINFSPFLQSLYFSFTDKKHIYFITDTMNHGTLLIEKKYTPRQTKFFAAQILLALKHLHSKGLVYRILSPTTVSINDRGYIKLCDMSECKRYSDVHIHYNNKSILSYWIDIHEIQSKHIFPNSIHQLILQFIGDTIHNYRIKGYVSSKYVKHNKYAAPEILLHTDYNQSVDFFAFGILIFEMLTAETPFGVKYHGNPHIQYSSSKGSAWDRNCIEMAFPRVVNNKLLDYIDDGGITVNILKGLLCKNVTYRIGCDEKYGIDEIFAHEYFQDMDFKMLEQQKIDPGFVPTVQDIKGAYSLKRDNTIQPIMDEEFDKMCDETFVYVDDKHIETVVFDHVRGTVV